MNRGQMSPPRESRPRGKRAADVSTRAGVDAISVDPDADTWRTVFGRKSAEHWDRIAALRARDDDATAELDAEFVKFGLWRRQDPEVRRLRRAVRRAEARDPS